MHNHQNKKLINKVINKTYGQKHWIYSGYMFATNYFYKYSKPFNFQI